MSPVSHWWRKPPHPHPRKKGRDPLSLSLQLTLLAWLCCYCDYLSNEREREKKKNPTASFFPEPATKITSRPHPRCSVPGSQSFTFVAETSADWQSSAERKKERARGSGRWQRNTRTSSAGGLASEDVVQAILDATAWRPKALSQAPSFFLVDCWSPLPKRNLFFRAECQHHGADGYLGHPGRRPPKGSALMVTSAPPAPAAIWPGSERKKKKKLMKKKKMMIRWWWRSRWRWSSRWSSAWRSRVRSEQRKKYGR